MTSGRLSPVPVRWLDVHCANPKYFALSVALHGASIPFLTHCKTDKDSRNNYRWISNASRISFEAKTSGDNCCVLPNRGDPRVEPEDSPGTSVLSHSRPEISRSLPHIGNNSPRQVPLWACGLRSIDRKEILRKEERQQDRYSSDPIHRGTIDGKGICALAVLHRDAVRLPLPASVCR